MVRRNFYIFTVLLVFCWISFSAFSLESLKQIIYPPSESSLFFPDDIETFKTVRVAVLRNVSTASVSFTGKVNVLTLEDKQSLGLFDFKNDQSIKVTKSGFTVGDGHFKIYAVRLSSDDNLFSLNGKVFRGDLVIIRQSNMKLLFVNYVNIEDYLRGVLPKEMYATWPIEALKAQALVSRTYAIFQEISAVKNDYSLVENIESQMYGGKSAETAKTDQAVLETKGEVLGYDGKIFSAYFHACCGGKTTACETVWYAKSFPPLTGVVSPFCKESPHFFWSAVMSLSDIERKLNEKGYNLGHVNDIKIIKTDASGRATRFEISGTGKNEKIKANTLRLVLGGGFIKSTKITTLRKGNEVFLFEGYGFGHGVGLCQYCAYSMAERGFLYDEIAKHFFPEAEITYI